MYSRHTDTQTHRHTDTQTHTRSRWLVSVYRREAAEGPAEKHWAQATGQGERGWCGVHLSSATTQQGRGHLSSDSFSHIIK